MLQVYPISKCRLFYNFRKYTHASFDQFSYMYVTSNQVRIDMSIDIWFKSCHEDVVRTIGLAIGYSK